MICKKIYHDKKVGLLPPVFFFLFFLMGMVSQLFSQNQDAILQVGRYWTVVNDVGKRAGISRGFMPYDYEIWGLNQRSSLSMEGGQVMTLYATNWYDDIFDSNQPVTRPFVACQGVETYYNPGGTVITPLRSYTKYDYAQSIVNGDEIDGDVFSTIDSDKLIGSADQVIQVTQQYAVGVNAHKTFLGWSHDPHSYYTIYEVVLENVGNDTLTDFHISFLKLSSAMFKSYGYQTSFGSQDDRKAWFHYYGGRQDAEGDSLRIYYWYWPDNYLTQDDEMGGPRSDEFSKGYFDRADMHFTGILHASSAPYLVDGDDVDDPKQPRTTFAGAAWNEGLPIRSAAHLGLSEDEWENHLGAFAELEPMTNQDVGTNHQQNTDELGKGEWDAIGGGFDTMWPRCTMVFGPYEEFPPGFKIRLVFANGWAGFKQEQCLELGHKWFAGTIETPPDLPNTNTGFFPDNFVMLSSADRDKNKNLWISTLIDSVHRSVSRAKWNLQNDFNIPSAPPPPSYQEVTGQIGGVEIKWSNQEAEALSNFAGHRIMRFLATPDTAIVEEIYRTTEKSASHTHIDESVVDGANYFYYVQSGAYVDGDPNANNALPEMRGKIIWSSRLLLPNKKKVSSDFRTSSDLRYVRIVPNPYNVTDPNLKNYGFKGGEEPRGIYFYGLPGPCTIRIYTEDGNLVRTLEHDDNVGRNEPEWDLLTDSQQLVQSGIYIAVIEDSDGNVDYEKFIIVR
ncbi:MAG: hypothetical protein V2J62_07500 [candidate division KSB1 bacterium]|jgi:hypothetical protein|nr:hypothetical protein [candidate division KSB1 bacterium]